MATPSSLIHFVRAKASVTHMSVLTNIPTEQNLSLQESLYHIGYISLGCFHLDCLGAVLHFDAHGMSSKSCCVPRYTGYVFFKLASYSEMMEQMAQLVLTSQDLS